MPSRSALPTLFLLASCAASAAPKPDPAKIVAQYVQALGGSNALALLRTETLAGTVTDNSTGKTGSWSRILKAPDQLYLEMVLDSVGEVLAYNGKSAWTRDQSHGPHTLLGEEARQAADAAAHWNGRLADAKQQKLSLQWVGTEQVRGSDAAHIHVTGDQVTRDVFFDSRTRLIVREMDAAEEFDYEDYRPVQGIPVAWKIELHRGTHDYAIVVTRAVFNSSVADSLFSFPPASATNASPLPDIKALLQDVTRNQQAIDAVRNQYTCHLTKEFHVEVLGKQFANVTEYETFHIAGEEVDHLIAKDGQPLTGKFKTKEDDRFNKEFDRLTKHEAELARDPKKQAAEQAQEEEEQDISALLRAASFSNARRESFRGEPLIVVDFGANPDYKPKSFIEDFAQKLSGVLWIDDRDREVVREQAHFVAEWKILAGERAVHRGSNFVYEQARTNGDGWLPAYEEVHFDDRMFFVGLKGNMISRYTDCRKFHADTTVIFAK